MISITVLVIDDDSDFSRLVKFVLEYDTNWKILTASNGETGLTKARSQQPSIILLDMVMPGLDGLEVYYLLKSNPITRSIPIIFVTAMVSMEKIIKLQITEDIQVITKPFDILTLKNQVINACDRYLDVRSQIRLAFLNGMP
ncbi:response regulator [Pleurocapsa sp. FMAR1]|uniref:response regulator n=1 Tax=Pleurocapsa sp. FMAR1 TaxID=3040204 RepID=UPI0029C78CEC|nr:response regulator [Pleurocapsa sp. FMAR1]